MSKKPIDSKELKRLAVYVPASQFRAVKVAAAETGRSMSDLVVGALAAVGLGPSVRGRKNLAPRPWDQATPSSAEGIEHQRFLLRRLIKLWVNALRDLEEGMSPSDVDAKINETTSTLEWGGVRISSIPELMRELESQFRESGMGIDEVLATVHGHEPMSRIDQRRSKTSEDGTT